MNVRAKTKRRLLILLSGAVLIVGSGAGYYAFSKHRIKARVFADKERGLVLFGQGKYTEAVDAMAHYVKRFDDADVIYTFVQAKRQTPVEAGQQKIVRDQLRRFVTLRPDRLDVWRELSDLYLAQGYVVESLDAAMEVLKRDPNDLPMLRRQVAANAARGHVKPALEIAERINTLAPDDLYMQVQALALLKEAGRAAELLPAAEKHQAAHANDGRGDLVLSAAYSLIEDFSPAQRDAAWKRLEAADPDASIRNSFDPNVTSATCTNDFAAMVLGRKAARHAPADADTARVIAAHLEGRLLMVSDALSVLVKLDPAKQDDRYRQELAVRMFEQGYFPDAERVLTPMSLSPGSRELLDLLGMRAVVMIHLGKNDAVKPALEALAAADKDPAARAWLAVLRRALDPQQPPRATIDAVKAVLAAPGGRIGSYPLLAMGDAYVQLQEPELALDAYARASAGNLWSAPRLRMSRLLADANRVEAAMEMARAANRLAPNSQTMANLLVIWAKKSGANLVQDAELARRVRELQKAVPGEEQTLPLHVAILAATNKLEEARAAIRAALAPPQQPSRATLLLLADASRQFKLGLDEEVLAAIDKAAGTMTPDVALARAMTLHRAGKTPEGAKVIEVAAAGKADAVEWRVAAARYLEQTRDRAAAAAWAALADDPKLSGDLDVQKLVAAMPSVRADKPLLLRTIERIRATAGEQTVAWRLIKARMLLSERTEAARAEAATVLEEAMKLSPENAEAVAILASIKESSGDSSGAIELYESLLKRTKAQAVAVALARLHHLTGDVAKSQGYLAQVDEKRLTPAERLSVAWLSAQQGDSARALRLTSDLDPAKVTDPALGLFLADLRRSRGQLAEAEAVLRALLEGDPDARVVFSAAEFFASTGRPDDAQRTLKVFDALASLKPGEKDYWLAEFESRHGSPEKALQLYRAAADVQPTNVQAHTALIVQCLRAGQASAAVAAADAAAKLNPSHAPFDLLRKQAGPLAVLAQNRQVLALAEVIVTNPRQAPGAVEGIRIVAEGVEKKLELSDIAQRLRPVADQWPQVFALQRLTVNLYRTINRYSEAMPVAQRTMQSLPGLAEASELAATTALFGGDYQQALTAGARWREQTLSRPLPADLLICDAHVKRNDIDAAWKQVERYFAEAQAKPEQYFSVVRVHAALLCKRNKPADALALLRPLLPKHEYWRATLRELAVDLPDAAMTAQWLAEIQAATPDGAPKERGLLASTWFDLGVRLNDESHKTTARAILKAMIERNPQEPTVYYAQALVDLHDGNTAAAQAGYRKCLAINANHVLSLNNLAMSLAENNGDLDEALKLAHEVVRLEPTVAAFRDTLAYVLTRRKEYAAAVAAMDKAIELEPGNPIWPLNQAFIYDEGGQGAQALKVLLAIDRMDKHLLAPTLKERYEKLKLKLAANK